MLDPTDPLSQAGRTVLKLDAQAYRRLVVRDPGIIQARDILESIRATDLITGGVKNPDEAAAMLAGLWLFHDYLDESHKICQALETESGSFWHAIVHRREGDFANSKYWYARCPAHPALKTLGAEAGALVSKMPADKTLLRLVMNGWNAAAFVDLVESVHADESDPKHALAVAIQQIEWRTLFSHNTRLAAGG